VSYSFDGVDDVLTVSPGDTNNEQVTFFVTLNPTSYGENTRGHCFAHGSGLEGSSRYGFYLDDNTSGTSQALSLTVSRSGGVGRWRANSTAVLNVWQSAAVTYDGTLVANAPIFYRNGAVVASANVTAGSGAMDVNEPQTMYLGNTSGLNRTFAGQIGIVAMWNRLLSPSEIALVHHCGVRKVLRGLQLWYRGTGALSASAPDWTGLGRPATVTVTAMSSDATGDRLAAG